MDVVSLQIIQDIITFFCAILESIVTTPTRALQDMANHDFAPSTNFTYEDPGVFRLRAMRDMADGEEVKTLFGSVRFGSVPRCFSGECNRHPHFPRIFGQAEQRKRSNHW